MTRRFCSIIKIRARKKRRGIKQLLMLKIRPPAVLSKRSNSDFSLINLSILSIFSSKELAITVVDDVSNVTRSFHCPQNILISKMKYFRDISLEEVDISVHCDINIFAWIMDWVKQKVNFCSIRN